MDKSMQVLKNIFSIESETAIVTGGASGIGASIAECFHSLGANVIIADLNEDALKKQQEKIGSDRCKIFQCDIADESKANELSNFAIERFGKVDILVNSHGISRRASADDITSEDYDVVLNVNLRSVFLTTSIIGRHMVKRKKGSIINISSISAHVCLPNNVNYSAAKGGMEAMTRSFAGEWAKHGVRVNVIAPGPVRTPFTEAIYADPAYEKALLQKVPRGVISTSDEYLGATLLLASGAGANIVGQTIVMDGGFIIV